MSDDRTVILRPVTLDSSGSYKCEVSADMPSFHTESQSANMLVVGKISHLSNIHITEGYFIAFCVSQALLNSFLKQFYLVDKKVITKK